MIFSEKTITVMKNFSMINQSLIIDAGNTLRTVAPTKTMFAEAELDNEFPSDACIYDVSRFLAVLSLFTTPDVEFKKDHFIISENKRKMRYTFADRSMVGVPPKGIKPFEGQTVEANIAWSDLESVIKAASKMQLPEIAFVGQEGKCYIRALNSEVENSDTYSIDIETETQDEFKFTFGAEKLKLLPMDYAMTMSPSGISKFKGSFISYYVPVEQKTSYFNKQ